MLINTSTIVATLGLFTASAHAYGMIAQVVDSESFCVFLPPEDAPDRTIAESEWNANAYCMGSTPLAKDAGKLPDGFITSAHYVKTNDYVQVTGTMDYTKANLVGTDEGGQMDIKAPKGSSCAGWEYYVNLIEPISNTYCMRCCNDSTNCNRGISEKGCAHIIPGDYSGPTGGNNSLSSSVSPSSTDAVISAASSSISTNTASSTSMTSSSMSNVNTASATASNTVITSSSAPVTAISNTPTPSSSEVTEQSLSDGYTKKPAMIAIAIGTLVSAIILA